MKLHAHGNEYRSFFKFGVRDLGSQFFLAKVLDTSVWNTYTRIKFLKNNVTMYLLVSEKDHNKALYILNGAGLLRLLVLYLRLSCPYNSQPKYRSRTFIVLLEATWLNWCHSTSLLLQMSDYNYLSKDNNLSEFSNVYFQISYVYTKSDGLKIQEPEKSLLFLTRLHILGQ